MIYPLRTELQGTDHKSVGPMGIEACSLPTQGVGDAKGPLRGNQAAHNSRFSHVDWPENEGTVMCCCMWVPCDKPMPLVSGRNSQNS